jgi:NTP pyrophosphatase (non-canonical NTP hydrolase)
MKKLFKKHYKLIQKRGLINKKTYWLDFVNKMDEELEEIKDCYNRYESADTFYQEVTDLMMVCANLIIHNKRSLKKEIKKNIETQKKRIK